MLLALVEAFIAIAREGTVSRAAESLYLTQPAMTARLRALERDVGVELFTRTARGMRLTDAGRVYHAYAERVLALVRDARQAMRDVREGVMGELVIAAAPAVSTYVLPEVLKEFRAAHPDVRLGVRTGHSEDVLAMVLRGDVQVGLGRPIRHADITAAHLYEDEMVMVCGPRHRLANRHRVPLGELASELLILFDRTSSYHELTSAFFRESGIVPRGTMELDHAEAAKKMVELELGIALLPRAAVERELAAGGLGLVDLAGVAPLRRPIVAMRRGDSGPAIGPVAWFLATLDLFRRSRWAPAAGAPPARRTHRRSAGTLG